MARMQVMAVAAGAVEEGADQLIPEGSQLPAFQSAAPSSASEDGQVGH